ncbi:septal ring lytic transglycosylase RlpA family protein [Bradyrhizobium sp. UFLA05-109]
MSRFECARTVHQNGASQGSPRGQAARLVLAVIGAASLAACAQSPVARQKAEFATSSRQAMTERRHETRRFAGVYARPRHHAPTRAVETRTASQGVASFYSDDQETASGEKFDKHELTAAHPTLPFGTRLRVTNVSTGRSVTVRVNDRGPYVRGRVVDVSYSAAEALGMVNKGVANVKLDVVQ